MNNCIAVPCLKDGSMDPDALDAAITKAKSEGKTPFFVSSTAGTTVLGAYDPFVEIKAVIDKHTNGGDGSIWFHVDGAWGGSVCFSKNNGFLMNGAEHADSLAWNFQKGLGVPVYCAALVVNEGATGARRSKALEKANAAAAEYIFHDHDAGERIFLPSLLSLSLSLPLPVLAGYVPSCFGAAFLLSSCWILFAVTSCFAAEWDLGVKSLQCGRRPDSLKMWLCWKRFGSNGFAARIDKAIENSKYLASQITERAAKRGAFHLVTPPTYANCCWYYVPTSLREQVAERGIESIYDQLESITVSRLPVTDCMSRCFCPSCLPSHHSRRRPARSVSGTLVTCMVVTYSRWQSRTSTSAVALCLSM